MNCDVAIVGGGPAGTTVACLLKVHQPDLDVVILESERFPRDHVGESLLPVSCLIMDEMGCWQKVEAANFPVKLGAFYRWGVTDELIKFNFLPGPFTEVERPGKFGGQREKTTWQVDRGVFDKILLDHARSLGCRVFESSPVVGVDTHRNSVTGLRVKSDQIPDGEVTARYYVDASGSRAMIRRAFDIGITSPTSLKNIAVWDYWQNAESMDGQGPGTFIRILSLEWGWLWFIAIGDTRTSIGLVTSAEYYKRSGLTTEQLYAKAIAEEPNLGVLLKSATRENQLQADKDWSYLADKIVGENWFLTGDSCGFADPILSAGITLSMSGSKKAAYSILELEKGDLDPIWIRSEFDRTHRATIRSHIRFADYWYASNKKFTDLEDYCTEIAKDAGLTLSPKEAFRWIGTGGFTDDMNDTPMIGTYRLSDVKSVVRMISGEDPDWLIRSFSKLAFDLKGAQHSLTAVYRQGGILKQESYTRDGKSLVLHGLYKYAVAALQREQRASLVATQIQSWILESKFTDDRDQAMLITFEMLEDLYVNGWIQGS